MSNFAWLDGALEDYRKVWNETSLGEVKDISPGRYTVRVDSAILKKSKADKQMVEWNLVFSDGKYKNETIKKFSMLHEDRKAAFLKRDMLRCGISVGDFVELENDLLKLHGIELEVDVEETFKNGTVYTNVNIVRAIEDLPF